MISVETSDLLSVVASSVCDLGTANANFKGIFAPVATSQSPLVGVTSQFLEDASVYHSRYSDNHYWSMLLNIAIERMGAISPKVVLDIGSGSGNSVIPLLMRFPEARVVATDISPNLLAILRDYFVGDHQTLNRLDLLCADASTVELRENSVDLVVGAAILHHIVKPETVVKNAFSALRAGGWAVFFEPFKGGSSLLTLAYKQVLREAKHQPPRHRWSAQEQHSTDGLNVLARIVHDFDTRVAMSVERAMELDDKWMFQKTEFEAMARRQGWSRCDCYSLQDGKAPVRAQTEVYLRLAAQLDASSLPDWAWQILDEFDSQLADDVRFNAWMEGMVLFQKPPH